MALLTPTPLHSSSIDMVVSGSAPTTDAKTTSPVITTELVDPAAPSGSTSRDRTPPSPPLISPSTLPSNVATPEVSMVEASDFTGVTFSPELWMQRRHWAMEVLRAEGSRSVLDLGCGPGSLLQTLVVPSSTIPEKPIKDTERGDYPEGKELFITRLTGVDQNPGVMTSAMQTLEPSASTPPRWETLYTELWLGGIERYNARLEGYDAIVALELVEHLEPNILSRFGVVTLGTYRPKLMMVSTPNFDFNSKFPDHDALHNDCGKRGFADPTGRTDRVFRHSDHKCEMTAAEFENWAIAAAGDWGYHVEIGGVGISNKPSYYPEKEGQSAKPVYATHTAIFRLDTGVALRSPRSMRTVELPFMRGANEAAHPHRLAAKYIHPVTAEKAPGAPLSPQQVSAVVKEAFSGISVPQISLAEAWGLPGIAAACGGSQRHLVACLGGWGDCPGIAGASTEFEVLRAQLGLAIRRR